MAAAKASKKSPSLDTFKAAVGGTRAFLNEPAQDEYASPVAAAPLEYALTTLRSEVAGAHAAVENLYSRLEPFLPRHLFEDKGEGVSSGQPDMYSEHDPNMSSTVLEIHKALNELTRLQQRLNFINGQVVR
jgi:hypothetical protein